MAGYIIYSLDWSKFQQFVERPTDEQLVAMGRLLAEGLGEDADELDEDDPMVDWPTDAQALAKVVKERLAMADWYGDLSSPGKDLWESAIFDVCTGECDEIDVGFRVDSDGVYWDVIELAWKHLDVVPGQLSDAALSAFGQQPYRYHPTSGGAISREVYEKSEEDRRASLKTLQKLMDGFMSGNGAGDLDSLLTRVDEEVGISEQHKGALNALFTDDEAGDAFEGEGEDDWRPMHSMHPPDEVRRMLAELQSLGELMADADEDVRHDYEDELLPALTAIVADGRMLFVQVDT